MRSRYKTFKPLQGIEDIYFITLTVVEWIPIFTYKEHLEILADCLTFCRKEKGMKLYAYVLMENHLHLIVSGKDLSRLVQSFKSFTSKQLILSLKSKRIGWMLNQFSFFKKKYKKGSIFQIWQEGFHPKIIGAQDMLSQKIEYIHLNPVRRGYITKPEYWKYSSAGKIINNEDGVIEIDELVW